MSTVTIDHPTEAFKKLTLKTTPATPLKHLVDTAVEKWGLGNAEGFGLRHGKNNLDLSLSMRFANLAQGAKLSLVPIKNGPAGPISIALQTPDGTRLVDKFPASTTLWNILVHFETRDGINLTKRTNIENKMKKPVYMMPVCVLMNKEFSTIESLKNTTLQKAGLTSGNGVVRVLLRGTSLSLEDAMQHAEQVTTNDEAVIEATKPSPDAPVAHPHLSAPNPETAPTSVQPAPQVHAPPPVMPTLPQNQTEPQAASDFTPPSFVQISSSDTSLMDVDADYVSIPPVDVDTGAQMSPPVLVSRPSSPPTEQRDTLPESEPESLEFDREIRAFRPPPEGTPYPQFDLPESFYDITPTELKLLLAQHARHTNPDAPLMTRQMRERELQLNRQRYPKTMVRIRFGDWTLVQLRCLSMEKLSTLKTLLNPLLKTPSRPYTLYTTPPFKPLDMNQTFWEANLAPAVLIHFKWDDQQHAPSEGYLNDEWLGRLEDLPGTTSHEVGGLAGVGISKEEGTENGKKRAKWLPSLGGNGGEGGRTLGGNGQSLGSSSQGLYGDQRDAGLGRSPGSGMEDAKVDKKPKWFKIGRK
ncbi:uncharacterized protein SPPG_01323 [Spizellomyces punctatus DAOM BR117]|uniref:UBX domain-containing protein n=1 Tax=Spizellomyces punctatus (strain DAOM BR117) TaxID=645134 RepID=A0A0L0HSI4_SPIPD|nr:uncharacterized protein SPPG_01323 [Spizellomyces punctatus DAOM BR117]KND03870.1 hypothetical protein SPPG_01323 [Spizellomyces punctatus DAOM BR117]|eukprot:XP_016611909.1 hypothetical protein SPPG_01323 [Spizellomyces punctatus DAOM BR117]